MHRVMCIASALLLAALTFATSASAVMVGRADGFTLSRVGHSEYRLTFTSRDARVIFRSDLAGRHVTLTCWRADPESLGEQSAGFVGSDRVIAPRRLAALTFRLVGTVSYCRVATATAFDESPLIPTSVRGARFLDLFSGSGASALEAVSRGAAAALCVDQASAAIAVIGRNVAALEEVERFAVQRADACRLGAAPNRFDFAFLDPPYGSGLALPTLAALVEHGWLAPDARVTVEIAQRTLQAGEHG